MGTITFKGGKKIPQKRKKGMSAGAKVLIILGSIFIGLPLLLVGTTYACFYDDEHVEVNYRPDYPIEDVMKDVVVHSIDNTVETEKMRLRVGEEVLNQVFQNVLYKDGKKIEVLDNLYINIKNSKYTFVVEIDLYGFFKTRLFMETKLTSDDTQLTFKITNLKLGRVSGLDSIAKFVMKHSDVPDINKTFHEHGFHINVDLLNLKMDYKIDDLFDDLSASFPETAGQYKTLFFELFKNPNLTHIYPEKEKALEVEVSLDKMRPTAELYHIADYEMPQGYLDTIMAHSVSKTKEYLDSGTITQENAQAVASYYVVGYDHLTGEQQSIIDGYLSGENPIEVATDTYNYVVPEAEKLNNIAMEQIVEQGFGQNDYVVSFNTNMLDRALSQCTSLGNVVLLTAKNEDGTYTVNFIVVDRITTVVDVENGCFYISVSVNVNGYNIALSLKTTFDPYFANFGQARFLIQEMYCGETEVSQEGQEYFLDLIDHAVEEGAFGDTISITSESGETYLFIDMTSLLTSFGITSDQGYSTNYYMTAQSATTPGQVVFEAHHS